MPQSRLPDVNTSVIVYRREAIITMKSRNYTACIGALYALNGLLPKEYRVIISSIDYNEKTKQDIFALCNFCNKETDRKALEIKKVILPIIDGLITGSEYEKFWLCPLCHKLNRLLKTRLIQKSLKEPYFLKVVPKPPQRKEGVMDHSTFHNKFIVWATTLLVELEAQLAQFRDDNWHKGDEMFQGDQEVDTSNEDYD